MPGRRDDAPPTYYSCIHTISTLSPWILHHLACRSLRRSCYNIPFTSAQLFTSQSARIIHTTVYPDVLSTDPAPTYVSSRQAKIDLDHPIMYGRSSAGTLDRYDDPPAPSRGGGGERWDRARFESMRKSGPPPPGDGDSGSSRGGRNGGGRDDHDHFRFHEHDKGPGYYRDVDIHEDRARRGPPVMERERFYEDDRYHAPSRRRHDIFEEPTPSEVANRALAPYRRQSVIDKDINIDLDIDRREVRPARSARPARPQYMRRQSSLDTFDRRPLPRYGDVERFEREEIHEYRLPPNVPIPLPLRERRRSPPRRFREEDDFEEIRYDDRGGRGREREDYREVEVHREKSRVKRSKSVAKSTRSSSISSFEEIQPSRATYGKKGRTRMPKRLVKKQAVIDLGYPFEEEVSTNNIRLRQI
jgi:hypothetical protein